MQSGRRLKRQQAGAGAGPHAAAARKASGGWRSALPLCLLGLALAGLPARAAADSDVDSLAEVRADSLRQAELDSLNRGIPPPDLPVLSRGDILFSLDAAAFPPAAPESLPRVEFYLRVSNDQLRFKDLDHGLNGRLGVSVDLEDSVGLQFRHWSRLSNVTAGDTATAGSAEMRQVLQWNAAIPPGLYTLEVSVEDLLAPKKTILGRLRGEHLSGTAVGRFRVRGFAPESLEVSDIEFAESWADPDSSIFRKPRLTVYPNPGRRYGQSGNALRVYVEGHLPAAASRAPSKLTWEVLSRQGSPLMRLEDSLTLDARFDHAQTLRLAHLPAGHYRLRLTIQPPGGIGPRSVEGGFDMVWAAGSALDRSVVALADQATLVFGDEELERFQGMSPGEQEEYWDHYWAQFKGGGPDSSENEALHEFEYRIQLANAYYGGNERGMFTDRGRTLITYGPPDEIIQNTMPTSGETLTDIGPDIPLEQDSTVGKLLQQPGGRPMGDVRAYEIWDYDMHGRLLFGTQRHGHRTGSRMRFVFVDDTGVGIYHLKYSSE